MATDLDIINAALTRTGNEAITSLEDGTTTAAVAAQNYSLIVENELASYRWRFATKTEHLNRIAGDPGAPYTDEYQMPSDALLIRTLHVSGVPVDYEQQSDRVLGSFGENTDVMATYVWNAPPEKWPGLFREAITQRLEAVFLRAIGERYDEAEAREKSAMQTMLRARVLDAQSSTPRNPYESSILRARLA